MENYQKPRLLKIIEDNPPKLNRYWLAENIDGYDINTLHDSLDRDKEVAIFYDWRVAELCVEFLNHDRKLRKRNKRRRGK